MINSIEIKNQEKDFRKVLLKIINLIGIKPEKLSKLEIDSINHNIVNLYPNINEKFLLSAFYEGVKQNLDIDIQHFQSFNMLYISNVILSYKRFLINNNKIKNLINNTTENEIKKEEDDPKDCYEFIRDIFKKEKKEHFIDNWNEPFIANWNLAFKYMEDKGIINYSNEYKMKIRDQVISETKKMINERKSCGRKYDDLVKIIDNKNLLKMNCRKKCIINYFK